MYCTYITFYRGNLLPPFYIGYSTVEKISKGYRGSVSSENYKSLWKSELKNNPHLFETRIISTFASKKEAKARETYIQKFFKVHRNPLYTNKNINGENFYTAGPLSEEHRKKIAVANTGKVKGPRSEETKKKISDKNLGKSKGPQTENHKKKISEANKGKSRSKEARENVSNGRKGIKFSEEHRRNLSLARQRYFASKI